LETSMVDSASDYQLKYGDQSRRKSGNTVST
jgi:hypothetical protein